MKQTIFKGSGVAIITPMLEDGSVTVSYTHLTLPTKLEV